MTRVEGPLVSIILVNYRGVEDTLEAIRSIGNLDWDESRLELIVVDNASGDDSVSRLRREAPSVRIVESKKNLGFAGGCNLGVNQSRGDYLAFLNNDARPDKNWVSAAIDRFEQSGKIGAVASKVLDWDGGLVDFIDAALTWFGMGYKPFASTPIPLSEDHAHEVLFGTGAAMFVRRAIYKELGGFDERFFMFYEDVDFGWRLNLAGYSFFYEPKSVAYHRHHASMKKLGKFKETYLLERNALFTLYKNLGQDALDTRLAGAVSLAVRRAVARGNLDSTQFDIRNPGSDAEQSLLVAKDTMATVFGIDQFIEALPELSLERARIQSSRKVSETKIRKLFGETDAPSFSGEHFNRGYANILNALDVLSSSLPTKVLVITGDPLGKKIAGPAIRALKIAETLAVESDVRLVSLQEVSLRADDFEILSVQIGDEKAMREHERWAEIIIFQGSAMSVFRCIRDSKKIIVVDIYDPMHLENLEQGKQLDLSQWNRQVEGATCVLNQQLKRGDFFICASELQRQFYLGQLAALGRLNPATYQDDPEFRGLLDVVPFGLSNRAPEHKKQVVKGVYKNVSSDDKLILWSGGLYDWFDPKTLIIAVSNLSKRHPNVRLLFMGTAHPHPDVPEMRTVTESRELARDLGVLNSHVFFNESWVEFDDRENYLLEADLGVSTHHSHVETQFAFRTRILDYLWAELPIVVTEGDFFAELVRSQGLGLVVDAEDAVQLEGALEKMLFDATSISEARDNISRVRPNFYWESVLQPLVRFINNPSPARDRQALSAKSPNRKPDPSVARVAGSNSSTLRRAWHVLRRDGFKRFTSRVWWRFTRGS